MPHCVLLLFTVLALMLAACGGETAPTPPPETNPPTTPSPTIPPPPPSEPALTLSGTANGYTGAEGTLTATVQNTQTEVSAGTIAADGSFSLELPSSVAASALISGESYTFCGQGSISISPANWQLDNFFVLSVERNGVPVGALELSNIAEQIEAGSFEGYQLIGLYYGADAVTLAGTCKTAEAPIVDATFDLQLQKGWNYVLQTVTEGEFSIDAITLESVAEPPADLSWEFFAEETSQPQPPTGSGASLLGAARADFGLLMPKTAPLR